MQKTEKKVLLEYALKAYERAIAIDPKSRFNYQMGLIYGQMGKQDLMIEKFLDELYTSPQNSILIQNQFSRFMVDDADLVFANQLRKALLVRVQKDQDLFWNQMLSWFFVQQKEYGKAFIQEKAIYKRNPESLDAILSLAYMAVDDKQQTDAISILEYVLENTNDVSQQVAAHTLLMQLKIEEATPSEYAKIDADLNHLFQKCETGRVEEYGTIEETFSREVLQDITQWIKSLTF